MALDKIGGLGKLNPSLPLDPLSKGLGSNGLVKDFGFQKVLEQVTQPGIGIKNPQELLPQSLKFSSHAIDRMKSRGINFSRDELNGIENAVSRAAAKGSKDTLILAGGNALIVSVKNNTVVTVMDRAAMKENVFTNIDSTVVI